MSTDPDRRWLGSWITPAAVATVPALAGAWAAILVAQRPLAAVIGTGCALVVLALIATAARNEPWSTLTLLACAAQTLSAAAGEPRLTRLAVLLAGSVVLLTLHQTMALLPNLRRRAKVERRTVCTLLRRHWHATAIGLPLGALVEVISWNSPRSPWLAVVLVAATATLVVVIGRPAAARAVERFRPR